MAHYFIIKCLGLNIQNIHMNKEESMSTIKLTNGLRKLKAAQIKPDGSYEAIITVADLTQITAETAEGETKLAAGNYVIYSKKNKGLTTGSLGLYALEGDAEKTLLWS